MGESRFFLIDGKGKLARQQTAEEAIAAAGHGGYVWFDYVDPDRAELNRLIEPLGLHPLAIEDCLDNDQLPKMEAFNSNTFLIFNRYRYADRTVTVDEVDFFLGGNFVVTVNHDPATSAEFYRKLDELILLGIDEVKKGPEFLAHVVLDYVVDRKYHAIELLEDELDRAEETIIKAPRSFAPEDLMHLRRSVLALRKSLFHEREILVRICRRDSPFIGEKAIYHYRDIYDHLTKFFELTEIHREMITSLMEMYLSLINNEMARISNKTNQVVRRLTLITTIFMPLTLLSGIGGMSEWSMMTGPEHWPVSYPLFLLGMAVIGGFSYLLLKRIERHAEEKL